MVLSTALYVWGVLNLWNQPGLQKGVFLVCILDRKHWHGRSQAADNQ